MKQLIEFIPLVLFFIFFKLYDIYAGVTALMLASSVALLVIYIIYRTIDKMNLFAYCMVMLFGALTLYFHNDAFIKWKVTIIYSVLAIIFLVSHFFLKKNLIQNILGKEVELEIAIWKRLNIGWSLFFIFCAMLNMYIMLNMSNDVWVDFKSFGLTGLTLVFTIFSGIYIYKNTPQNAATKKNSL